MANCDCSAVKKCAPDGTVVQVITDTSTSPWTETYINVSVQPNAPYTGNTAALTLCDTPASESCFVDWPNLIDYTLVSDPANASNYYTAGKITRLCVTNGPSGAMEYWVVMLDDAGNPQFQQVV